MPGIIPVELDPQSEMRQLLRAARKKKLPTMYDLPSENPEEPGLPDMFHDIQAQLLKETFCPPDYPSDQLVVAKDLNLYFDPAHQSWYKRPDWMAVVGTSYFYKNSKDSRRSYVIWDEPVKPFLVVELLSPQTAKEDLGRTKAKRNRPPPKWEVYERIVKIPYYVVFSGHTSELHFFRLTTDGYREESPLDNRFWFPEIRLGLGLWQGVYGIEDRQWLRWYDETGNWIPTPIEWAQQDRLRADQEQYRAEQAEHRAEQAEHRADQAEHRADQERHLAEQERHRAEQEQHRADQAEQRAEQLAAKLAKLRALGIDLDQL